MNISLQNVDKVSALLTVKVEKADYKDLVDKSLKTIRQKAQIPGFRKGMVPMGLVRKMYHKAVVADEIDKILPDKIYGYIKENNLKVLGEPLPNEKQQEIDFDTMEEFEFIYDLALTPEFELKVNGRDKVDYYEVEIVKGLIDEHVAMYTQQNGRHEEVDTYQEKDLIKGLLTELDEQGNTKEGGICVEHAVLMPVYMKDEAQKALFDGSKINDVVTFNPNKAFGGAEAEIATLLKVEQTEVANLLSDFSFQIEGITRYVNNELDQNVFDRVFGEGVVKTEEEFRARIKAFISGRFTINSDYKFLLDAREVLMKKVADLELPDALLKRFMILTSDRGADYVEENYEQNAKDLIWYLIKEKLVEEYGLKVEQADIINMAKEITKAQFAQYGMHYLPEDMLDSAAKGVLEDRKKVEDFAGRILDQKLINQLKEKMKLNVKVISVDEFQKFLS